MGLRGILSMNADVEMIPTPGATHQQVTVGATAKSLNSLNSATRYVIWTLKNGDLRVKIDGNDPTDAVGLYVQAGSSGRWSRRFCELATLIRDADTVDAVLDYQECAQ